MRKPRLKVLMLGPYPPPYGGMATHMVTLEEFLRQREICCEMVNLTSHRKHKRVGVRCPETAFDVLKILLQAKADIIHMHVGGNVTWRLLALGLVCSLLPGSRVVFTLHSGSYPNSPAAKAARPFSLRGFLFRRFDGLIGVNRDMVEVFLRFGVRGTRIRLVLPFALPAQAPEVVFSEATHRFFEAHSPVLLSVSGLEPEYDVPLQIETLGRIRETHPGAGLLILGSGSRETELRDRIQAKPYADDILLGGEVPRDVVLSAMALSDVLLRTTLYDGDSISVREALHLGLPVVTTDNGMRPDGVTLIPMSDCGELCNAIRSILSSPRVRRTPPGTDDRNLQAVLDFYQELFTSPRRNKWIQATSKTP